MVLYIYILCIRMPTLLVILVQMPQELGCGPIKNHIINHLMVEAHVDIYIHSDKR